MRQRNDTAYELYAPGDPGMVIAPGEEVDSDIPIAGLTPVDEQPAPKSEPKKRSDQAAPSGKEPAK